MNSSLLKTRKIDTIIIVISFVIFTYVFLFNAWVSDDAYITFRTVSNFVNGYGLIWNPGERVQAYTHPLWMLLISLFYYFTSEVFYTSIVVSYLLCLFSILTVCHCLRNEKILKLCLFLLLLISSRSFIDYSSSGLENPLTFLLISIFYAIIFSNSEQSYELTNKSLIFILLIASLSFVNRQDTILLYLPTMVGCIISSFKRLRFKLFFIFVIGFLPAILWLSFSLIYYGGFFPNVYYAKLHTGIAQILLLQQGLKYYLYTICFDPNTLLFILIAVVAAIFIKRDWVYLNAGLGIVLYLVYIVMIGGDFFGGRFFSVPFFLSSFLLIKLTNSKKFDLIVSIACIMAILYNPFSPVKSNIDYIGTQGLSGITDQRGYYYPYSGFLNYLTQGKIKHEWYIRGEKFREQNRMAEVFSAIGFFGFAAGPKKYIIDEFGLSDPLLSRLPVENKKYFWIGHFKRKIPRGYVKSIMLWKNKIKDPNLELYYDKIVNITRGSIFSLKRFKDIFYLNTGKFEHLKDLYFNNPNYIIENYPKSCLSCKLKSRE